MRHRPATSLLRDGAAATAVEYALILAAFAAVIIFAFMFLGKSINSAKSDMGGPVPGETTAEADGGSGAFIREKRR